LDIRRISILSYKKLKITAIPSGREILINPDMPFSSKVNEILPPVLIILKTKSVIWYKNPRE
jgi:hypothetical protein